MFNVSSTPLPDGALLTRFVGTGAYTDCYAVTLSGQITLADYLNAFYTSWVFRIERWILGVLANHPSTDADVVALTSGQAQAFAVWQVEDRTENQILLAAGPTRSWFLVTENTAQGTSTLHFGSAVLPRSSGELGTVMRALLGFHKLYSRILLMAAGRRITR